MLNVDMIGSAYDLLNKPNCLEQKYIDMFRYKVGNGFYTNRLSALDMQSDAKNMSIQNILFPFTNCPPSHPINRERQFDSPNFSSGIWFGQKSRLSDS